MRNMHRLSQPPRVLTTLRWTACGLAWALGPAAAAAQDVGPDLPPNTFNQGVFRFDVQARRALQALWQASVGAQQERLACIGGYRQAGVAYITKVEPLAVTAAALGSIAARESLERCGPPRWLGTVHTHIATFSGHPYVTFSRDDRRVMSQWRMIWQAEGVFCVLYNEQQAHCEAEPEVAAEPLYAYARGNRILQ
ncbi:MAG: hypothetical protein ACRET3_12155 [Burkholderiales bacterium]